MYVRRITSGFKVWGCDRVCRFLLHGHSMRRNIPESRLIAGVKVSEKQSRGSAGQYVFGSDVFGSQASSGVFVFILSFEHPQSGFQPPPSTNPRAPSHQLAEEALSPRPLPRRYVPWRSGWRSRRGRSRSRPLRADGSPNFGRFGGAASCQELRTWPGCNHRDIHTDLPSAVIWR